MDVDNKTHISYIGDLTYSVPDDVLLVEQDRDYVFACNALSNAAHSGASLQIWVRSKNHFTWLKDFAEQIGDFCAFDEKTPRIVLAEYWNVTVPEWLSDSEVIDHKLLEFDVENKNQTSFTNRLLATFLGSVFQSNELNSDNLSEVIKALVKDEAQKMCNRLPLLSRALSEKCAAWSKSSQVPWVKEICDYLPVKPGDVWRWLSYWSILSSYPEKLLEYVLSPKQVQIVRKIPSETVHALNIEPLARSEILTQLELFFNEVGGQVASSLDYQKVVSLTSGKLRQEFDCLTQIIKDNRFPVSDSDVQALRDKFETCPGITSTALNALSNFVRPSKPALLDSENQWSSADWIKWAVNEYAPYRSWQIFNSHYDDDLEQTVQRFSEWYINEYTTIQKDPDLSLIHYINSLRLNESSDRLTVILLIDCLPIEFMGLLDEALRSIGLHRHELAYRFSALPSTTEYNKPPILAGNWEILENKYESILAKRAESEWPNQNISYLSNIKALSDLRVDSEQTVAVLNLIDGDHLLHSDVESKNTTYAEELNRIFMSVAEALQGVLNELLVSGEGVSVCVVTDHGACRMLEEETRSLDSNVINKLFPDEKYRFSAVGENDSGVIPENLWVIGHKFHHPFIKDHKLYFLPKGHNTVRRAGRSQVYMHGGITPEEIIVPTALYKPDKLEWKPPSARFLNLEIVPETGRAKFYIQRVVSVKIEIQNPNPNDLRLLKVSVLSPETDIKGVELPEIKAGDVGVLEINCYFKKTATNVEMLEMELEYGISGETYRLPLSLESEFKSAMAGGFRLKDL